MEDFTRLIDEKDSIDVIYLDFRKAFDSVPHERLFVKLRAYGIAGNILYWIRSFLTDRKQRVVVRNKASEFRSVTSGVPQGSVLGPLLFILFINDIPDGIDNSLMMFADDTKLYGSARNSMSIQNDLVSLYRWSSDWQMEFNISKCKILHIGRTNPFVDYFMDSDHLIPMQDTESEKDLGVIFDRNLNFDRHIHDCVCRSNRIVGIIYRSFEFMGVSLFLSLYKSIIRPLLEYGNSVWSPLYKRQSISIENVQRRATRMVPHLANLSYLERLKCLDLPSLKYRRRRGDLIHLFRIVHNIDDIDASRFFTYSQNTFTRGDKFKIYIDRHKTNIRRNSFIIRTVSTWNNLKFRTKNAPNLNTFKILLDRELIDFRFLFDE